MPKLLLADIDGVFLDLETRPNKRVFDTAVRLMGGSVLYFVTGRDAEFLHGGFIPALELALKKASIQPAEPVIIACENGCIWLTRHRRDWESKVVWQGASLEALREEVCHFAQATPGVEFQAQKRIVLTVSRDHSLAQAYLATVEQGLAQATAKFQALAEEFSHIVEFQRTTNACDLIPKGQTKAAAARQLIAQMLFVPTHVHLLGDAPADLGMAEPCVEQGWPHTFWYVGRQKDISHEQRQRYVLQFPSQDALYDQGALEVLTSLSQGDLP